MTSQNEIIPRLGDLILFNCDSEQIFLAECTIDEWELKTIANNDNEVVIDLLWHYYEDVPVFKKNCKLIKPEDLVLYSNYKYKSKRFFDLMEIK
jgi:hypothetical protein